MTFHWKHWFVVCGQHCGWFTQYFPPDQKYDPDMDTELRKGKCPDCRAEVKVRWKE